MPRDAVGRQWSVYRSCTLVWLRPSAAVGLTLQAARLQSVASGGTEAWLPGTRGIAGAEHPR